MSDSSVVAPLRQRAGYGVVIGLGALFAVGMIGITTILRKRGNKEDAEEFTGRSTGAAQADLSRQTFNRNRIDSCRGYFILDLEVSATSDGEVCGADVA